MQDSEGKKDILLTGAKAIQITIDFISEIREAMRNWHNIFQVLKGKNCQPQIQYPVKFLLEMKGNQDKIKTTKKICCQQTYPKIRAKEIL